MPTTPFEPFPRSSSARVRGHGQAWNTAARDRCFGQEEVEGYRDTRPLSNPRKIGSLREEECNKPGFVVATNTLGEHVWTVLPEEDWDVHLLAKLEGLRAT